MSFQKVAKSKVGKGILAAVAIYFLSGLLSGSFGEETQGAAPLPGEDGVPEPIQPQTPPDAMEMPTFQAAEPIQTPEAPVAQEAPPQATPVAQAPTQGLPAQTTTQPQQANPATQARAEEVAGSPWYQNLSPSAKSIIAGAMMGGGAAVMNALAMKNQQEAEREREDRMREDRKRRTQIPEYREGFFTNRGLVDSRMG